MSVIPVTVFLSLGLVVFFVVLFLREHRHRLFASAERDSLLPLAAELPRVVGADQPLERGRPVPAGPGPRPVPPHDHPHRACGCARGERPPCAGCAATGHGHR